MKFLAIDTSQEYLSVVAKNGNKIASEYITDSPFKHSITLLDAVEKVLISVGLKINDLDFIGSVVGAGSFTGIRIGISTVKGFCAPQSIKALKITAFDTLAYTKTKGKYLAVIDAKHDNFYIAGYLDGKICIEPKFVTKSELEDISKDYVLLSGTEIAGIKTEIVNPCDGLLNATIALKDNLIDASLLEPLYLRLAQAEEGRL